MSNNLPKYLIVHHSGGTDANPLQDSSNYTVAMCDSDHKIRFGMQSSTGHWAGYHYFIDKAGVITQTRLDTEEGAHTIGYNLQSLGVCLAGNFDATMPTEAQKVTLTKWLREKTLQYNLAPISIVPHRKFANKTCYGKLIANDWAMNLILTPEMTRGEKLAKAMKLLLEAAELLKGL